MPGYQMFKFVGQPGRMRKVKKARATAIIAGFVALVIAILLIPTPLQISGALVLTAADAKAVYAKVPGRVARYMVVDGQPVKERQLIATLSNLDKFKERDALQSKIHLNRALGDHYNSTTNPRDHASAELYYGLADQDELALNKVEDQIRDLNLVAPRDGIVIGLPHHETEGQWLEPTQGESKPLCLVGDPTKLQAVMILDQSDVDLIRARDHPKAWLKIYGTGMHTVLSRVESVAIRSREDVPPELSNQAGGEIAAQPDSKTGEIKPLSAVFEVAIPVDNQNLEFQPGLRGKARIDAGYASFGWWLWRLIAKTFHFNL
jgi:putative peptide zinc metalloprotease protein